MGERGVILPVERRASDRACFLWGFAIGCAYISVLVWVLT
jgi:hypothetical protein